VREVSFFRKDVNMWARVGRDLFCGHGEPIEEEVDLIFGQRKYWVGAYPLPFFLWHLNRCLEAGGRADLVVTGKYTSVKEIKPHCGELISLLRDWVQHGAPRPEDVCYARRASTKEARYLLEGLEHIERAPDPEEVPWESCEFRDSILVHLSGTHGRMEAVYEQIQDLLRRAQVESLVELAQKPEIKISQSLMDEVVIIRSGVAERTPVRVAQDIKEALGDKLLTNEQGRKEATQWLSYEIAPSPLSTSEEIADGNPTS
jgi:hypothetical protein